MFSQALILSLAVSWAYSQHTVLHHEVPAYGTLTIKSPGFHEAVVHQGSVTHVITSHAGPDYVMQFDSEVLNLGEGYLFLRENNGFAPWPGERIFGFYDRKTDHFAGVKSSKQQTKILFEPHSSPVATGYIIHVKNVPK